MFVLTERLAIPNQNTYSRDIQSASRGLSSVRSSNSNSHFSIGILFSSLKEKFLWLVNLLKSCLGLGPNLPQIQPAVAPQQTLLNKRIVQGNQIIDIHFNDSRFNLADGDRSVAVIVFKYNNMIATAFRRLVGTASASVPSGITDLRNQAIGQLSQLLSNNVNRDCGNGTLQIETIVFKKVGDGYYDGRGRCHSICFSNGETTGSFINLNRATAVRVANFLDRLLPTRQFPAVANDCSNISTLIFREI
jgi:hypothetical protein